MPNWCENTIKVYGENKGNIERFFNDFKKKGFGGCLPMPKELHTKPKDSKDSKERITKYGADNWYDWAMNNWGTKWDVNLEEDEVIIDESSQILSFDTAWSPPDIWIAYASKYYNITIEDIYEDDSMPPEFVGRITCANGWVKENIIVEDFLNPSYIPVLVDILGSDYLIDSYEEILDIFEGEDEIVNKAKLCIKSLKEFKKQEIK